MRVKMRFVLGSLALAAVVCFGQFLGPGKDITQVGFYVAAREGKPGPSYRVKSFRLNRPNSPELAGKFRGLAARDVEKGVYEYILEPEAPPPGASAEFNLTGEVHLFGDFAHWITLRMPNGVLADIVSSDSVRGRVLPAPGATAEPMWIRFQDVVVHSNFYQAKLNNDGLFRIPDREFEGDVVITVCRGSEVLFLDHVHFTAGRPDRSLELRLQSGAPQGGTPKR